MDHKRQHWIPRGYLKAWCDPEVPDGHEPYVWQFATDGRSSRRKAPKTIFCETELYTLSSSRGERDLRVEHSLAGLESRFVQIREKKLLPGRPITLEEHVEVCAFIAAMQSRTPFQLDHWRANWVRAAEMARRVQAVIDSGQAQGMTSFPGTGPSLSLEEVESLAASERGQFVWPMIASQLRVLCDMNLSVLTTDDVVGFITSDSPCVWFDPEAYRRPPHMQSPGLSYETVEITLPSSPTQMLVLTWRLPSGYIAIGERLLGEMNRRTRFHAQNHFIVSRNVTRAEWFAVGRPPRAG